MLLGPFFRSAFVFSINSLILPCFPLTSFLLSEASLSAFSWLYTLECAVVPKRHEMFFIYNYSHFQYSFCNQPVLFAEHENINKLRNTNRKLPTGPNRFYITSVREFYKSLNLEENSFPFTKVSEKTISDILKELKTNKAIKIDNLSGRFLKDGSKVLATPIAQICNLSIKLSTVPDECKIAKLNPLYKKGKKTDPKN